MGVVLGSTLRLSLRIAMLVCIALVACSFAVSAVGAETPPEAQTPVVTGQADLESSSPIVADTVGPTAKISARVSKCVWNALRLKVRASDASGVASVDFSIDDEKISATVAAPYTVRLSVRGLARGSHSVVARVRDNAGNITIVSKRFRHCSRSVRVQREIQPLLAG